MKANLLKQIHREEYIICHKVVIFHKKLPFQPPDIVCCCYENQFSVAALKIISEILGYFFGGKSISSPE